MTAATAKITSKTTSSTITNDDDDAAAVDNTTTASSIIDDSAKTVETSTSLFAGVNGGDNDVVVADESLLDELRTKILALKIVGTDDKNDSEDINYEVDHMLSGDDDDDNSTTNSNLRRLLIARQNDIKKAYEMGKSIIMWRAKMKPHLLSIKDFPTAHAQGVWRFAGYAKNGWGIIKIIAKNWSSFSYSVDEYCKMVAYYMEHNINRCKNSTEKKNFLIFDMKHMSYLSDIRKLRVLAKLTNDYYPERLGIAVIVNCDWVFDKLFNIMIKWVDVRTSKKAIDFRTNGSEFLLQHVDQDQFTVDLGGTRDAEWPLE